MTLAGAEEHLATETPPSLASRSRRTLLTPLVILLFGAATVITVQVIPMDSLAERSLNLPNLAALTWQHIVLTAVSTVLVLLISVPLGILLSRRWMRWANPIVLGVANVGQAAPAVGLVVLLAVLFGIGFWPAIVALVVYSVLPALRNTLVGLEQVDPTLIDAGRGIGMPARRVLARVELPLAVPVILAGVRTTLVLNVGVAAVASFIGAGGLGELITNGVTTQRTAVLLTGCILIALLALLIDWLGGIAETFLGPKGL